MHDQEMTRGQLVTMAVAFEGGLGVIGLGLAYLLDVPICDKISVDPFILAFGAAAAQPMLAVFALCVRWPIGPLRPLHRFMQDVVKPLFRVCTLADLALICLFAGIGEEVFFRGWLQPWLENFIEPWAALVLASLLFGLFHPINTAYVVLAGIFGLYLGWLYVATDSLIPPILAHALYDFIALVYLVRKKGEPGA